MAILHADPLVQALMAEPQSVTWRSAWGTRSAWRLILFSLGFKLLKYVWNIMLKSCWISFIVVLKTSLDSKFFISFFEVRGPFLCSDCWTLPSLVLRLMRSGSRDKSSRKWRDWSRTHFEDPPWSTKLKRSTVEAPMFIQLYNCIYIYIYICIHICIYTYIYIFFIHSLVSTTKSPLNSLALSPGPSSWRSKPEPPPRLGP